LLQKHQNSDGGITDITRKPKEKDSEQNLVSSRIRG